MKALGIIFSNIYDDRFGELTKNRTVASLPFGGRYRLIDFVLSNMSNSGIYQIGIITKYNYRSLMDNLGSYAEWDLNRKNEGPMMLPPFVRGNTGVYKGKLEALYSALHFMDDEKYDYVVMSDSTVLCNIDYRSIIDEHASSGADITVIASAADEGEHPFVVYSDENGTVTEMEINAKARENAAVGMGMFIISRKLLTEAVKEAYSKGYVHLERDFIQRKFNENRLCVHVHKFDGIVFRNESITDYLKNNLSLLDESVHDGLFQSERPIYTKVRDELPTYYSAGSKLENCIVADGCILRGRAKNSVLFRGVVLEKDAAVENCMIMQGTIIGEGARLENVIADKNVVISANTYLKGTPEHPVIIAKGETV